MTFTLSPAIDRTDGACVRLLRGEMDAATVFNTDPADQARAWKARFAPTVLFLGPNGQELAERLVGVAVPDFYGSYLEARLAQARARLK